MNIIKKTVSVALLSLFSIAYLQAQMYVSGGLGYGIPATPEQIGVEYNEAEDKLTNYYGNSGTGFRANAAFGYMFNDNFGAELGAYYFTSPEILAQDTINGDAYYRTYIKSWHLRLTPALVFMAGSGKVIPYAKVGLCIPVTGLVNARRESNAPGLVNPAFDALLSEATDFKLNAEFKGKFSLGFESVVGGKYNLSDKLSLFGEVFFTSLRIRRASAQVTRADAILADGSAFDIRPVLAIGGVYEHTEFVDELNLTERDEAMQNAAGSTFEFPNGLSLPITDYGTTPEKAHKQLASEGAYNAIGINIGVRFNF